MAEYEYVERAKVTDALIDNTSIVGSKLEEAVNAICAIPAADVRPVVYAEWILVGRNLDGTSDFECSACWGMLVDVPDDDEHDLCAFCPNCGADMREVQDG